MDHERFIHNHFRSMGDIHIKQLQHKIQIFLSDAVEILQPYVFREMESGCDDFSLYTGLCGILMTLKRLKEEFKPDIEIPILSNIIRVKHNQLGLCSNSALYMYLCLQNNREYGLNREQYTSSKVASELLYGRAGHAIMINYFQLKGMLLLRNDVIEDILSTIDISQYPWSWKGKIYYGAAHGTAGILYTLQQLGKKDVTQMTLDFITMANIPHSGNFKSSHTSSSEELVQWCHGAPGVLPLLLHTSLHTSDIPSRVIAQALEITWKKGILKKGHGICHGTAGNGYSFLTAFQLGGDEHRLFQALAFADIIVSSPASEACHRADRPYSLFEGLAGTVHFILDIRAFIEKKSHCHTMPLFDGLCIF
mmetsp:Transcript_222/g.203  ORF Transcript_222/g.203 Transcript_222/m.203 type:complete len:365 (-) Transcript_222:6-1100(-)